MKILDVRIDEVTMSEAIEKVKIFLDEDKMHLICTPNPEMLMTAQNDEEFKQILNSSVLNIPDGTGIVWAAEKLGNPLKERVAGFDFIHRIFELGKDKNISFYFLGSKPGVAETASKKIEGKYPGIKVVGTNDGYFSVEEEKGVIKEINSKKPDVLLVAMGAPKQERFINKYKDNEIACIGDELINDVWTANRMNFISILVNPIGTKEYVSTKVGRIFENYIINKLTDKKLFRKGKYYE